MRFKEKYELLVKRLAGNEKEKADDSPKENGLFLGHEK